MSNINIKFVFGKELLKDHLTDIIHNSHAQKLMHKYPISRIEQIEFNGENIEFLIDLDTTGDIVDWDAAQYPSDTIRNKVFILIQYNEIINKLDEILNKISRIEYEDYYSLERLATDAVNLISTAKETATFEHLKFYQTDSIGAINYTIGKEIAMVSYLKARDSEKRKRECINRAKDQLSRDINRFLALIKLFDVNH